MTDGPLDTLRELTGLEVEEVIGVDAPRERLDELHRQFLLYFPDHAHVVDELTQAWAGEWPDPQVVVHAWLLELDGAAVGFAVVHTSVRRQVLLQHFIGMDPEAGARLPLRWVGYFMDALRDTAGSRLPGRGHGAARPDGRAPRGAPARVVAVRLRDARRRLPRAQPRAALGRAR